MRELKFRGWHVKLKKMFSAEEMAKDQLTLLPTGEFINVNGDSLEKSHIYSKDEFIPLQFVGSANNTEYYENDIVKVLSHYDGDTLIKDKIGIIKYQEYGFAIYDKDDGYICSFFDYLFNYNGGLIGSIYEVLSIKNQ